MIRVLFVCLGNICRSPTAHAVFDKLLNDRKLSHLIEVDSAGTGDWHLGHAPDQRAIKCAATRGYDLSQLRARKVQPKDFMVFDYILAMDNENLSVLQAMKPADYQGQLSLFLSMDKQLDYQEVPDPYYSGEDGFDLVLDLVESASEALLLDIVNRHALKND